MLKYLKYIVIELLISVVILSGCSLINRAPTTVPKEETCAILPFNNFSDTPLAGERVAAILYGILNSKGYKVVLYFNPKSDDFSPEEITKLHQKAKKEFKCIITGSVNEWRYKVGIDGEPAVSITYVIEKKGWKTMSGTLSGTDWGHKSLGLLTQELFNEVF